MISDVEQGQLQPKRRCHKLTKPDIDAISELCSKLINEQQACEMIGVKWDTFRRWKSRAKNSALFAADIARLREIRISNAIDSIDSRGDGVGLKQPDWRAKAFLLQNVYDPKRFNPSANQQPNPPAIAIQVNLIHEQLKKVIGVSNPEPKLIEEHKLKLPQRNK